MRRNTRGSRWISTKMDIDGSYEQLPVRQAATHNAEYPKDLTKKVPHVQVPSIRSWSSLRGSIDDGDDDISPRTTTRPGRNDVRSAISPLNNDPTAWRNSSMSPIEPIDFTATAKEWKVSDGTIFHSFSPEIKKPAGTSKDAHGEPELARFCRTARAIYEVGPKGEGQKLWTTYKRIQKGQKQHTEVEQKVPDPLTAPRRPSAPGLSAHPPTRPAPPDTEIPIRQAVPLAKNLYPRNHSEVSRTSCEVLIQIGPEIKQIVDHSRPLPPMPQLQAVPKARQQGRGRVNTSKPLPPNPKSNPVCEAGPSAKSNASRPLPPVPLASSARRRKPHRLRRSLDSPPLKEYSSSSASNNDYSTQQLNDPQSTDKKSTTTKPRNLATHWWKALADLTSEEPPIKPTIGRPRPITALESGRTPNLAIECGGVGGEGAIQPKLSERAKGKQKVTTTTTTNPHGDHKAADLLNPHVGGRGAAQPKKLSEVAKGKQKATTTSTSTSTANAGGDKATGLLTPHINLHFPKTWLDKLNPPESGRRRVDSDASFGCVGVEQGHMAYGGGGVGESGPSRLRPDPLFSGRRGRRAGQRDTKFYRPYEEVLDEYRA